MRVESVVRNAQIHLAIKTTKIILLWDTPWYKGMQKSSSNNLLPRNTQREVFEEKEAEEMVLYIGQQNKNSVSWRHWVGHLTSSTGNEETLI